MRKRKRSESGRCCSNLEVAVVEKTRKKQPMNCDIHHLRDRVRELYAARWIDWEQVADWADAEQRETEVSSNSIPIPIPIPIPIEGDDGPEQVSAELRIRLGEWRTWAEEYRADRDVPGPEAALPAPGRRR